MCSLKFCYPLFSLSSAFSASLSCVLNMETLCSTSSTVPLVKGGLYSDKNLSENDFNASTPQTYQDQSQLIQHASIS